MDKELLGRWQDTAPYLADDAEEIIRERFIQEAYDAYLDFACEKNASAITQMLHLDELLKDNGLKLEFSDGVSPEISSNGSISLFWFYSWNKEKTDMEATKEGLEITLSSQPVIKLPYSGLDPDTFEHLFDSVKFGIRDGNALVDMLRCAEKRIEVFESIFYSKLENLLGENDLYRNQNLDATIHDFIEHGALSQAFLAYKELTNGLQDRVTDIMDVLDTANQYGLSYALSQYLIPSENRVREWQHSDDYGIAVSHLLDDEAFYFPGHFRIVAQQLDSIDLPYTIDTPEEFEEYFRDIRHSSDDIDHMGASTSWLKDVAEQFSVAKHQFDDMEETLSDVLSELLDMCEDIEEPTRDDGIER